MAREAFQLLRAVIPAAVFTDVIALLSIIKEEVGRPPKVLLPVGIVALAPLVLCVDLWAE